MKKIFIFIFFLFLFSCCTYKSVRKEEFPVADIDSSDTTMIYQPLPDTTAEVRYIITDNEKAINDSISAVSHQSKSKRGEPHPSPVPLPKPTSNYHQDNITSINDEQNIFDNSVKNIIGKINYVIQDTMIVGITNKVNMTISNKNISQQSIINGVPTFNNNNLYTSDIRTTPIMKARLIDPKDINFKIVPLSEEEQFIENNDYTVWTWNVTPLTKGNDQLSLIVDIVIDDKSKNIKVYDGVIYVYSNETVIDKITEFLLTNWEFIVGTILIPLIVYLYSKFGKKIIRKRIKR